MSAAEVWVVLDLYWPPTEQAPSEWVRDYLAYPSEAMALAAAGVEGLERGEDGVWRQDSVRGVEIRALRVVERAP